MWIEWRGFCGVSKIILILAAFPQNVWGQAELEVRAFQSLSWNAKDCCHCVQSNGKFSGCINLFPKFPWEETIFQKHLYFIWRKKNDVHFSFFGTEDFFWNILHCPVLQMCLPKGSISYQCVTLSLFLSLSFDFADP